MTQRTFVDSARCAITPNEIISRDLRWAVMAAWAISFLVYWNALRPAVLPSPFDVLNALPMLWTQDGLGQELWTSFSVNLEALALSTAISLPLAYLSRVPAVRPVAQAVSKLRFVSPSIFFIVLLFVASTGHEVKVLMLAMGETFFLVTTMVGVVQAIPAERFDDARTLRMSEWQATWYCTVRGTLPQALDAIRDNAAMGFSMLMFAEGIVRSEGGVGVLLLNQEKHADFAQVYAIALAVLAVGMLQDWAIGLLRETMCPYAKMVTK